MTCGRKQGAGKQSQRPNPTWTWQPLAQSLRRDASDTGSAPQYRREKGNATGDSFAQARSTATR